MLLDNVKKKQFEQISLFKTFFQQLYPQSLSTFKSPPKSLSVISVNSFRSPIKSSPVISSTNDLTIRIKMCPDVLQTLNELRYGKTKLNESDTLSKPNPKKRKASTEVYSHNDKSLKTDNPSESQIMDILSIPEKQTYILQNYICDHTQLPNQENNEDHYLDSDPQTILESPQAQSDDLSLHPSFNVQSSHSLSVCHSKTLDPHSESLLPRSMESLSPLERDPEFLDTTPPGPHDMEESTLSEYPPSPDSTLQHSPYNNTESKLFI